MDGWQRARKAYAMHRAIGNWLCPELCVAFVRESLETAPCLQRPADASSAHSHYLTKLRTGAFFFARLEQSKTDSRTRKRIQQTQPSGVVTEVQDSQQASELELWQQGDAAMYQDEAIAKRLKMRRDPRVRAVLDLWWLTAKRGESAGTEDDLDSGVGFDLYSMMMRRVYRVMLATYDEADARTQIGNDWIEDVQGKSELTYRTFCDVRSPV